MSGEKEWQRKFVQKEAGQALPCGTWRCVDLGRRDRRHVFWGNHEMKKAFTLPRSEDMAQGMAILGHCNTHKMSELIRGQEHRALVWAPGWVPEPSWAFSALGIYCTICRTYRDPAHGYNAQKKKILS